MDIAELRLWYRDRFLPGAASKSEIVDRLNISRHWMVRDDETVEMLAGNPLADNPELADPQADDDRDFVMDVIRELEKALSPDAD